MKHLFQTLDSVTTCLLVTGMSNVYDDDALKDRNMMLDISQEVAQEESKARREPARVGRIRDRESRMERFKEPARPGGRADEHKFRPRVLNPREKNTTKQRRFFDKEINDFKEEKKRHKLAPKEATSTKKKHSKTRSAGDLDRNKSDSKNSEESMDLEDRDVIGRRERHFFVRGPL